MNSIYHYDAAASLLLVILIALYYVRRNYPTKTNKIYIQMVFLCLASSVFDIVSIWTTVKGAFVPVWFSYVVNMMYFVSYNGLSIMFYYYVLTITKRNGIRWKDQLICFLVLFIDAALLLSSPVTHAVFYIDSNGVYNRGPLLPLLYVTAIVILTGVIVLFARYHSRLTGYQEISVCFLVVLTIASALVQYFLPGYLISNFVCALFLVLVYVSLQNPDDYMNKQTHCYNDRAFLETIEKNMAASRSFDVIAFMPDDFEYINQFLGLETGDALALSIADYFCRKYGRKAVYHLYDGCFAILSDGENISSHQISDTIRQYFSSPYNTGEMDIALTPYICLVHYPDFAVVAEDILDALDYSFRELANKRENNVLEASGESLEAKRRESEIIHIMKQALLDQTFQVYYQPIYHVREKAFTSAEALVRLFDEKLGFISPEEFIPMAEQNGMIIEMGEMIFRKVCRFLKSGKAQKLGVKYIEVNLSVVQCMQDNLAERMLAIMEEYNVPCDSINFEITETAGVVNDESLRRNMDCLIEKGTSFAMDDYGTGFSTAVYLTSMPTELIKIDKSLLWAAMRDQEALVILYHIVQMLKDLNKRIVVEGVETDKMRETLEEMGCDYLQGYLFSRPVPEEEYIQFLEDRAF